MKTFTILKLDKERKFRLSNIALFTFEEITGKDFFSLTEENEFGEAQVRFSIKDLNAIVYSGLSTFDENLTYLECRKLIDEYSSISELKDAVMTEIGKSSFFKSASNETNTTKKE